MDKLSWPLSEDDDEDGSLVSIRDEEFGSEDELLLSFFRDFFIECTGGDGERFWISIGGCERLGSAPGREEIFGFLPI